MDERNPARVPTSTPDERERPPLESASAGWAQRTLQRVRQALASDWHGDRRFSFGAALLLITNFVVAAYYLNHPAVEIYPDSNGYIGITMRILAGGRVVDPVRLPGYPLLMALVFALGHRMDFARVSEVQGALFVLATVEIYALTWLVWRRAWIAFGVGLLIGTNIYLLKYAKPIVTDGLALWLLASLALTIVLCVQRPRRRYVWLAAGFLLALFMTRPEWVYAPIPVFAYLLMVAWRRGQLRRLLPHAAGAVAVLYLALGLYVHQNAVQNGYAGITIVQNVNLLGKVIQYRMQDEAPPRYAPIAHAVDAYVARGKVGPWELVRTTPALRARHGAVIGEYAMTVISHHPVEFLAHTAPVLVTSSSVGYTDDDFRFISAVRPAGLFGPLLLTLRAFSAGVYLTYVFFPPAALPWLVLALRRSTSDSRMVEAMGAVALLGLYALIVTSIGGYGDYARIHSSFDPLLIVVIWGSLIGLLSLRAAQRARGAHV